MSLTGTRAAAAVRPLHGQCGIAARGVIIPHQILYDLRGNNVIFCLVPQVISYSVYSVQRSSEKQIKTS